MHLQQLKSCDFFTHIDLFLHFSKEEKYKTTLNLSEFGTKSAVNFFRLLIKIEISLSEWGKTLAKKHQDIDSRMMEIEQAKKLTPKEKNLIIGEISKDS